MGKMYHMYHDKDMSSAKPSSVAYQQTVKSNERDILDRVTRYNNRVNRHDTMVALIMQSPVATLFPSLPIGLSPLLSGKRPAVCAESE